MGGKRQDRQPIRGQIQRWHNENASIRKQWSAAFAWPTFVLWDRTHAGFMAEPKLGTTKANVTVYKRERGREKRRADDHMSLMCGCLLVFEKLMWVISDVVCSCRNMALFFKMCLFKQQTEQICSAFALPFSTMLQSPYCFFSFHTLITEHTFLGNHLKKSLK